MQKNEFYEFTLDELASALIRLPKPGRIENFSFKDRPSLGKIFPVTNANIILAAGRQTGKSTFLAARTILMSIIIPNFISLYVSPTHMQTARFSNDKLRSLFDVSPDLLLLKGGTANDSILNKKFVNGSEIILRYCFRTADRIRGITAHQLYIDEFQDFLTDLLPVIEETLHDAPIEYKFRIFTGTFKTRENVLAEYFYDKSYQYEWIIPCDSHLPPHYNVITEKNLGKDCLICEKCGNKINTNNGFWARIDSSDKEKFFHSFRIPQVIHNNVDWTDIYWKQKRYTTAEFYNDVLALPYDIAERVFTKQELMKLCDPDISILEDSTKRKNLNFWKKRCEEFGSYMGVDWGFGNTSYTVVAIATYGGLDQFSYIYLKRYEGFEADSEFVYKDIANLIRKFNVKRIGLDFGYGFGMNGRLMREYGTDKVFEFEYVAKKQYKAVYNVKYQRFQLDRTDMLTSFFQLLKSGTNIKFPNFEEIYDPFLKNFLAIYYEENKALRRLQYNHKTSEPDDAVHAMLYALLVSCLDHPRPALFSPVNEK
jgi:hypothetical protein